MFAVAFFRVASVLNPGLSFGEVVGRPTQGYVDGAFRAKAHVGQRGARAGVGPHMCCEPTRTSEEA